MQTTVTSLPLGLQQVSPLQGLFAWQMQCMLQSQLELGMHAEASVQQPHHLDLCTFMSVRSL